MVSHRIMLLMAVTVEHDHGPTPEDDDAVLDEVARQVLGLGPINVAVGEGEQPSVWRVVDTVIEP